MTYGGGAITSRSTPGEPCDERGNILHAWRGASNDYIYIALNNGSSYRLLAGAGTFAQTWTPSKVIWTDDGGRGNFRIFHTGTEGHVYQHRVQLNSSYQLPGDLPEPTKIPNDTRTSDPLPVGAAALPNLVHLERCSSGRADDGPLRRAGCAGALVPAHHKVGTAVAIGAVRAHA
ncbi:hypothetical protein ACFY4H_25520 [Streptomyces althioticus]|uniref:hypothetical protein n=1 Tax=Streptomyces althioticus TaxID=83380 RepID=UPI0036CB94DA